MSSSWECPDPASRPWRRYWTSSTGTLTPWTGGSPGRGGTRRRGTRFQNFPSFIPSSVQSERINCFSSKGGVFTFGGRGGGGSVLSPPSKGYVGRRHRRCSFHVYCTCSDSFATSAMSLALDTVTYINWEDKREVSSSLSCVAKKKEFDSSNSAGGRL